MNAMVPGLAGGKMSSSDPNSKIDFLDSAADVKKKIKVAFCEPTNITENGLLSFHKAVLVPIQMMRRGQMMDRGEDPETPEARKAMGIHPDSPAGTVISVMRDEKWGGPMFYPSYEAMEAAFAADELKPADLKLVTVDMINALLDPIRKAFEEDDEWKQAEALAYPKEIPAPKQPKKTKVRYFRFDEENLADRILQEKKPKEKQVKPNAETFIEKSKQAATENVEPTVDGVAVSTQAQSSDALLILFSRLSLLQQQPSSLTFSSCMMTVV
jgi:tyrosyl-tRNA synthetase